MYPDCTQNALVFLIICFLVWTFTHFLAILLPVDLEWDGSDYLAAEPCLNKDSVLYILPGLHLVLYSDITIYSIVFSDTFSQIQCLLVVSVSISEAIGVRCDCYAYSETRCHAVDHVAQSHTHALSLQI